MVVKNVELEHRINKELKSFEDVLFKSLNNNRPFAYLELVSRTYRVPKDIVFNESFDLFNHYIKNGVKPDKAVYFSLSRTHELVLRGVLK